MIRKTWNVEMVDEIGGKLVREVIEKTFCPLRDGDDCYTGGWNPTVKPCRFRWCPCKEKAGDK